MNVRVYVEKQMEGLVVFAHALGMAQAFVKNSPSTIVPVDQHIRFVREVLPGGPISMRGCVVEIGDTDAVIFQELRHPDGKLAASFRTRIVHIDTAGREAFPWGKRVREALTQHLDEPPEEAAPRSLQPDAPGLPREEITLDLPEQLGLTRIGLGAVPPQHLDVHGRMEPAWIIGRVSDSVPNLLHGWRNQVAQKAGSARIGGAVLEYRIRYHDWPEAGDLFAIYSGFGGVEGKTHSLIHWIMDPVTRRPWATTQVVAITLDLDARKAIPAPPDMLAELERLAPRGLSI